MFITAENLMGNILQILVQYYTTLHKILELCESIVPLCTLSFETLSCISHIFQIHNHSMFRSKSFFDIRNCLLITPMICQLKITLD